LCQPCECNITKYYAICCEVNHIAHLFTKCTLENASKVLDTTVREIERFIKKGRYKEKGKGDSNGLMGEKEKEHRRRH
jgi:hypothetical protein